MRMNMKKLLALMLALMITMGVQVSALAWQEGTLYSGVRSEAVKEMQTALIKLDYLGGTPDGIYGTNTEKAVKKFQRANGLKADGVAGAKTLDAIYKKAGSSGKSGTAAASTSSSQSASSAAASSSSSGLFGGDYTTLRLGSTGSRVTALQKKLISLGYLKGSADGRYGSGTRMAVMAFQKANGLTADGLAGKKTLVKIEGGNAASASAASESTSSSGTPSSNTTVSGPSGSEVKLLHWFNNVKPTLKTGSRLYVYEPSSGLGWNLRVYARGRHCDAEPVTADDTATMLKAFGGKNTWSQKAVYVRLPNGTWTIGSTHTMPHLKGSISDNNFDGHLCVHFLRTMSEAEQNDPNYGVSNQRTIRAFWKKITGEEITD